MKICDFGLVRSSNTDDVNNPIIQDYVVATRWYRAPEILLGSNHSSKSADMWSIGVILAELLLGKPAFPGSSTLNQLKKVLEYTGKPDKEDIIACKSTVADTMLDNVPKIK